MNPFEYQGPIIHQEQFFDRDSELREALLVCDRIAKGSIGGILLHGGRASGKSSLLNALHRELIKRKVANAQISLSEDMVTRGNEPRLFKLILSDLTDAALNAGLFDKSIATKVQHLLKGLVPLDKIEIEFLGIGLIARSAAENKFGDLPYAILRDGLKNFIRLVAGKNDAFPGAILILDEGDTLTNNRELLQVLRNVFQEMPGVGLVVAGTSKLLSEVSQVFSPIPRFFRKIELGPFPSIEEVEKAISSSLNSARSKLVTRGIHLETRSDRFVRIVAEQIGRAPAEFNLISSFAYDIGADRIKWQDGKATLFMSLDKEVLDSAIEQLRGTREYVLFLEGLSALERTILSLLSNSLYGGSMDELTVLTILEGMGANLRDSSVEDVLSRLENFNLQRDEVRASIGHIRQLGEESDVSVLNQQIITKPIYFVEDQWVTAYFKYGVVRATVNLEFGLIIGDSGTLIFGDPISSIIDSVFLNGLIQDLAPPPPFRLNYYPSEGSNLSATQGKILRATFERVADGRTWHLAFHLKSEADSSRIKKEIKTLLVKLKDLSLISSFEVKERVGRDEWVA